MMNNIKKTTHTLYLLLFCAAVMLSGCGLFGEDSKPIRWEEEDLNDFVVYAYSPDGNSFAVIDLVTGEIYRHIEDFKGIQSVAANHNGSLIYVSTFRMSAEGGGEIYKVNTTTWEYDIIYSHGAHLIENRNGGIFFITKGTTLPLSQRIFGELNPATGEITEIDSIDVEWRAHKDDSFIEIHPNMPLIYTVNGNGDLYEFNFATSEIKYIFSNLPIPPLANFTLSFGGNTLYIPGGPVLDLRKEKMVGVIPVWRLGTVAARRDNKEVYITDPGSMIMGPSSQRKIFVYNPQKNKMEKPIDAESITDMIYLTPKERYAVANNRSSKFIVVDLKTRKVVAEHEYVKNNVQTQSIEGIYLAPKPPSLK